jgi:hypothetical protein
MIILFGGPPFKLLHWREPERADRWFYQETKDRLVQYPDLQYESEFRFCKLYWPYFIAFFLFPGALIDLFVNVRSKTTMGDLTGVTIFILCISLYPTIFGVTKIIYFFRYRRQEKNYHRRFLEAVKQSKDYADFTDLFYHGKISPNSKILCF